MTPNIRTVGVIGAGQMGTGIAQVLAQAGYAVAPHDLPTAQVDAALARLVAKERLTAEEADATWTRLSATPLDAIGQCNLVIEAATEDEGIKRGIFSDLAPYLAPQTILTTNTSSLSIYTAGGNDRPSRTVRGPAFHTRCLSCNWSN